MPPGQAGLEGVARVPSWVLRDFLRLAAGVSLPTKEIGWLEEREGTVGHAACTAALAVGLADEVGLTGADVVLALLAGYLHDAGKLRLAPRLLGWDDCVERLPDAERGVLRGQVRRARGALAGLGIPPVPELVAAIEQHREHLDGSGQPAGLRGRQVGMLGRIIHVAHRYEELTARRPCRTPLCPASALEVLGREAREGRADAGVVAALERLVLGPR